jgi:hypothetical protein
MNAPLHLRNRSQELTDDEDLARSAKEDTGDEIACVIRANDRR